LYLDYCFSIFQKRGQKAWIPASAGMTERKKLVSGKKDYLRCRQKWTSQVVFNITIPKIILRR
jgi:hypothetical protein